MSRLYLVGRRACISGWCPMVEVVAVVAVVVVVAGFAWLAHEYGAAW
jgi:hypothetical protein